MNSLGMFFFPFVYYMNLLFFGIVLTQRRTKIPDMGLPQQVTGLQALGKDFGKSCGPDALPGATKLRFKE